MKKLSLVVCILLIFAVFAGGCGGQSGDVNSPPAGDNSQAGDTGVEKIVIRLAHEDPPDNQWGMGALHFAELVEQKTDGRVEIQVYDHGQLGHGVDNIQQLQTGALEMTLAGSPMSTIEPFFDVFTLPYLFRDRDHVKDVLASPVTEVFEKYLEQHGLVGLGYWEAGFRQITNNKRPIVVPEDLKGIKIRVPDNAVRMETFKAYGANPMAVAYSELYTALQQGVVEAQENPYGNIWGDKIYEVQKYVSESNHVFVPIVVLVAKDYYEQLPADIQQALKEAAQETGPWQIDWAAAQEADWIQDILDFGCEVNKVDQAAFMEASKPIWDSVISQLGPEAQEVVDTIVNTK